MCTSYRPAQLRKYHYLNPFFPAASELYPKGETDSIYSFKLVHRYSQVQRLSFFDWDKRASVAASDELSNAYFSKAMLLVEGATELELFTNSLIRILFPKFSYFDVFPTTTDKVKQNLLSPEKHTSKRPISS